MIFQTKSVGIDVQPDSLRIAVAAMQGDRIKVLNLIEKEFPGRSEEEPVTATASILREAFDENGLTGDACAISLPAATGISRLLTMPISDPAKIRQTLKFQIEPQIPYPIDGVIADYVPIQRTNAGAHILAVAVTKDVIAERLRLLKAAEVDAQIITLDAIALADFYMNPFDFSPDKITALLLINHNSSFLGFFEGERLVGFRNLDGISVSDTDTAKRLVKEIQRSLLGFRTAPDTDSEIGTLCVAGEDAESIQKILQQSFPDFPVRTVAFNEGLLADIPPVYAGRGEEWRLAIALARAGLGEAANPLNFMREEFIPVSPLSRLKQSLVFSLILVAVVFIAWMLSVAAEIRHRSRELETLNKKMVEIFADTMPGITSPESARQKFAREQEKFNTLRNYSSEYVSPLDVLAAVTSGVPAKKSLTMNDLTISDHTLRMAGEAESFDDINMFKERLENSPLLSEVTIDSATKAERSDKRNFRIRARIGRADEGA